MCAVFCNEFGRFFFFGFLRRPNRNRTLRTVRNERKTTDERTTSCETSRRSRRRTTLTWASEFNLLTFARRLLRPNAVDGTIVCVFAYSYSYDSYTRVWVHSCACVRVDTCAIEATEQYDGKLGRVPADRRGSVFGWIEKQKTTKN